MEASADLFSDEVGSRHPKSSSENRSSNLTCYMRIDLGYASATAVIPAGGLSVIERISLLKLPEKSFSTATADFASYARGWKKSCFNFPSPRTLFSSPNPTNGMSITNKSSVRMRMPCKVPPPRSAMLSAKDLRAGCVAAIGNRRLRR